MSGNILLTFNLFDFSSVTKVDQTSSSLAIPNYLWGNPRPKIDGKKKKKKKKKKKPPLPAGSALG